MKRKEKQMSEKKQDQTAQVPAQLPNYELWALSAKKAFLALAPEKKWTQEIFHAITILRGNMELQKCEMESIKNAVINIATTGATLNPAHGQAYLIPRKGKCCLDFSYKGLAKLATDSGAVLRLDAHVVHEKDRKFDYWYGSNPDIIHYPSLEQDQGKMTHVYAVANLKNGLKQFIVLTKTEVEKVRQSSQAPNSPMWRDWPEEGARKTAIKKLYKLLPQTEQMSEAISVLNEHEGIDFDFKPESELEKRLNNSKDITPKVEPEGATGTDSHSGKGTPSAGGEGVKFTQESPPSVNEEKTTISPEEAEAIHQRELKEAGLKPEETKQQTAPNKLF